LLRPRGNIHYIFLYLRTILLCWLFPFLLFGFIVLLYYIYVKHQITANLGNIIGFYLSWFKGQFYIGGFRANHFLIISRNIIESIFYFRSYTITPVLFYSVIILSFFRKRKETLSLCQNILFFSSAAVAIFLCTFLFYEPNNLQRYTPLLIFLWLAICSLLRKRIIFALTALFLFINNLIFVIGPEHKEQNNIFLQEALLLREATAANDIIVIEGERYGWPSMQMRYIPYFAGRVTLTLADKRLMDKIGSAFVAGYRVFITEDTLNPAEAVKKEALDSIKTRYSIIQYAVKGKIKIYQITKEAIKP